MAFNPFHGFRKHQKTWFAALTIVCMVVFVLGGAFGNFREITAFFGGSQPRGNELVLLYGRPVTTPDLSQLRYEREVANQYMLYAVLLTEHYVNNKVLEGLKNANLDQATKDQLSRSLSQRQFSFYTQRLQQELQQVYGIQMNLEAQGKKNEAILAQKVFALIRMTPELMQLQQRGTLLFGGDLTANDLVDFRIWRHQADRLGIQFSRPDIRNLRNAVVQAYTTEPFPDEEMSNLVNLLRQRYRNVSPDFMASSLDNEFKVMLAQRALVKSASGARPDLTPYDLWSFFRDQRTESIIAMLPIPVAQKAFFDKVLEPTEEELKTFFDKNKDRLYNPESPEAGFKQPPRIQLEWVRARADSPIYQQAATVALDTLQATLPIAYEGLVSEQYNSVKWQFRSPSYLRDEFLLHNTSTDRATNVAAAVGQIMASSGTHGPAALAGYVSFTGAATFHEVSARLRAGTSLLLSGSADSPLSVLATAAAGFPATEYLPLEQIRWAVEKRLHEDMQRQLMNISLTKLNQELDQLSQMTAAKAYQASLAPALLGQALASFSGSGLEFLAAAFCESTQDLLVQRHFRDMALSSALATIGQPVPLVTAQLAVRGKPSDWSFLDKSLITADAQKIIAKAIDKYHWDHGTSRQPRDRYTISEDPGLEPLREAFNQPWPIEGHSPQTNAKLAATEIFNKVERSSLYAPQRQSAGRFGAEGDEFLFWKTGQRPSFVPSFEEVKAQVRNRWKEEKARPLAKEAAEQIVAKLPKNTTGEDVKLALKDADPKVAGTLFELDHVASLVSATPVMPTRAPQRYEPYKVPAKYVEYPGNLAKDLLKMTTEGTAIVVHDKPEDHYYVAVLVHRSTPYELTFFSEAQNPDALLDWYEKDTEVLKKNRQSLLAQLRDQAGFKIVDEKAFRSFGRSGSTILGD
jgi:hypothetical protein